VTETENQSIDCKKQPQYLENKISDKLIEETEQSKGQSSKINLHTISAWSLQKLKKQLDVFRSAWSLQVCQRNGLQRREAKGSILTLKQLMEGTDLVSQL